MFCLIGNVQNASLNICQNIINILVRFAGLLAGTIALRVFSQQEKKNNFQQEFDKMILTHKGDHEKIRNCKKNLKIFELVCFARLGQFRQDTLHRVDV